MRKEHDWIWWAALIAGGSFMIAVLGAWSGPAILAWKGLGVALLAVWAATEAARAPTHHRGALWLITLVLACGAVGDVVIDAVGLEAGGATFACGHIAAIVLYALHRRDRVTGSQRALAVLVVPVSALIAWAMVRGQPGASMAIAYTALVAAMASAAWTSAFSRYRTGIGAMLFLISDLLIFAREGGAVSDAVARLFVWPLYFAGQALIARGVIERLRAA